MLRGLDVAIVDGIDSVLIDDAGTPLLIAAQSDLDRQRHGAEGGRDRLGARRADRFLSSATASRWKSPRPAKRESTRWRPDSRGFGVSASGAREIVRAAVTAHRVLVRDTHYLVRDGKVVIIDQNTGRTMPDRYWGHDLHVIVEPQAKAASPPACANRSRASTLPALLPRLSHAGRHERHSARGRGRAAQGLRPAADLRREGSRCGGASSAGRCLPIEIRCGAKPRSTWRRPAAAASRCWSACAPRPKPSAAARRCAASAPSAPC